MPAWIAAVRRLRVDDEVRLVPGADAREDRHRRRSAIRPNQAMLRWPYGSTMKAASSGPVAEPALPPT